MSGWRTRLLLLLLAAASCAVASPLTTAAPEPANTTVPAAATPGNHRKAGILVIDITKNTSSIEPIPQLPDTAKANVTESEALLQKQGPALRCLTEQKANLFLLVHLNRNWRHKLNAVRRLLSYTYEHSSTNVAIVFFNAFTNILATFGTAPLSTELELLTALARVQTIMEKDEQAAVSEHWNYFQLGDALHACFRYARLFLHQLSLDARPSVLFSYFDDGAVISEATIEEASRLVRQPDSPFRASVSMLQWPNSLPIPPQWARTSELLASSPSFQLTGSTESGLLAQVAALADKLCNRTTRGV